MAAKVTNKNVKKAKTREERAKQLGLTPAQFDAKMKTANEKKAAGGSKVGGVSTSGDNFIGGTKTKGLEIGTAREIAPAQMDRTVTDRYSTNQAGAISNLEAAAAGRVPSAAELQMRQGLDQAQRNISSSVAAQGLNPALAARMSSRAGSDILQQVNANAAALRAQEMAGARGQLVDAVSGARNQDIGIADTQAKLNQQSMLVNQDAFNKRQSEQANVNLGFKQAQMGADASVKASGNASSAVRYSADRGLESNIYGLIANNTAPGQAAGNENAAVVSDKNAKTDISDGGDEAENFMDSLSAYMYKYKGKSDPKKHLGVMAQDVEKSPMGKRAVEHSGGVKQIDIQEAASALLASVANLNKRMKEKGM